MKTHYIFFAAAGFAFMLACGQMFAAYPAMRSAIAIVTILATAAALIVGVLFTGDAVAGAEYVERKHFMLGALPGAIALGTVAVALICGAMIGG